MRQVLIKDKKYQGRYVALKDFDKPIVIAHSKDPLKVFKKSVAKGFKKPVVVFVPDKNVVHIY